MAFTVLPTPANSFDLVTIHQVLHYLDDPAAAIEEAAKALAPGGRLLVVDFAPHTHEELRASHAHHRLGFSHEQVEGWLTGCGLEVLETRDLVPQRKSTGGEEMLTVTLWLARDQRMLIADKNRNEITNTGTA